MLPPDAALAQVPGAQRTVRIGFGGGMVVPVSDAADVLETGIHGRAFALVNLGGLPLRFNLGYDRLDREDTVSGITSGDTRILSASPHSPSRPSRPALRDRGPAASPARSPPRSSASMAAPASPSSSAASGPSAKAASRTSAPTIPITPGFII